MIVRLARAENTLALVRAPLHWLAVVLPLVYFNRFLGKWQIPQVARPPDLFSFGQKSVIFALPKLKTHPYLLVFIAPYKILFRISCVIMLHKIDDAPELVIEATSTHEDLSRPGHGDASLKIDNRLIFRRESPGHPRWCLGN